MSGETMDYVAYLVWIAICLAAGLISAGHALLKKHDPRAALGWVVISLTLPLVGPFLYWSMGVNRIRRTARQWQQTGRRLTGTELTAPLPGHGPADLPSQFSHLEELRILGDRVVTTRLFAGNDLVPLVNGEEAYPAMLAAIRAASRTVHLSTYIFDGDSVGREFATALRDAARRGVEVRVIVDSLGEKYSFPPGRKLLKGSGVQVGRYLPLVQGLYVNLRNHRKLLVVDGETGFTGGMNIRERHLAVEGRRGVADLHFKLEGPAVAELQKVFLEDWYFSTGEFLDDPRFFPQLEARGAAFARAIADGPDRDYRKLHWIIMGALSRARRRVRIMTPYFIPERPLIMALATTALRGVEVDLILPAVNNLPFIHWATRSYIPELLQMGIRVYYQPPPFVHSKLFLVDGLWSLIGSANLDPRSLRLNFEFNVEVYDAGLAQRLDAYFDRALEKAHRVTVEEMSRLSLPVRLLDGAMKLFSPYL